MHRPSALAAWWPGLVWCTRLSGGGRRKSGKVGGDTTPCQAFSLVSDVCRPRRSVSTQMTFLVFFAAPTPAPLIATHFASFRRDGLLAGGSRSGRWLLYG